MQELRKGNRHGVPGGVLSAAPAVELAASAGHSTLGLPKRICRSDPQPGLGLGLRPAAARPQPSLSLGLDPLRILLTSQRQRCRFDSFHIPGRKQKDLLGQNILASIQLSRPPPSGKHWTKTTKRSRNSNGRFYQDENDTATSLNARRPSSPPPLLQTRSTA